MRFYRALLHLFPRSFRAEYGAEMTKDFSREWHSATGAATAGLVVTTIADVAANAVRVHVDILVQDVKYAARSLRRTPGFTVTAILVAAIGIGATTATFSIADHVLIRALPFPESHQLMRVWEDHAARGYPQLEPSPPNFRDWQRLATRFEHMDAYGTVTSTLSGQGDAQGVSGAVVGPTLFTLLGRQAAIGRTLTEADANAAGELPIVISDGFWRRMFAATGDIIGQKLVLDGVTYIVVGVMPRDFYFPSRDSNYWRILAFTSQRGDDDRSNHYLSVLARLKDGVSLEAARSEMKLIAAQLVKQYPKELEGTSVTLSPWRDQIAQQTRLLLLGLVAASVCVLLIACTNLANLLMSRAIARRPEFALRAAIGASVDRLVRQMLTDSVLIAVCGGVLGIAIALAALPLLVRLIPTSLPIAQVPPLDVRMLIGTLVLTSITGLAFGLLPAIRICKKTDASALKDGVRGSTGRGTERLRSGLVVAEIVAAVVLIVCVGLLTQALLAVQRVDPGFEVENLLTARTQLPMPAYGPTERRLQYYSQVIDRVRTLPGVESASYISFLPMTFRGGIWEVLSPVADEKSPGGFLPMDPKHAYSASIRFVTPHFFDTLRTPILKGRDVNTSDTLASPFVAVVSESFAKRYFPGQDPLGRSFAIGFAARTIVGVVGDIKVRGLERQSEPQVYMPASQQPGPLLFFYAPKDLVIRASAPAAALIPAVRAIIREAEPSMPISWIETMTTVMAGETAPRLVQLRVLGGFAAIALLLAAIGIHGLLAFTVTSRVREIGVRIALGASARDIMWMVIGRSTALAAIGVMAGAALAYAAGRSMQALLFGVNPGDLNVFAAAVSIALLMALAGSVVPAWRAVRIDPIAATRVD
jgi:predicted permease